MRTNAIHETAFLHVVIEYGAKLKSFYGFLALVIAKHHRTALARDVSRTVDIQEANCSQCKALTSRD